MPGITFDLPVVPDQLLQQLRTLAISGKTDPVVTLKAAAGEIPLYGDGLNVRD